MVTRRREVCRGGGGNIFSPLIGVAKFKNEITGFCATSARRSTLQIGFFAAWYKVLRETEMTVALGRQKCCAGAQHFLSFAPKLINFLLVVSAAKLMFITAIICESNHY
jgi:hypothetical protein